jgi:hypothetical protein
MPLIWVSSYAKYHIFDVMQMRRLSTIHHYICGVSSETYNQYIEQLNE